MIRRSGFREQLDQYGSCMYFTVGTSMLPLLRERKDVIYLKKNSGRLSRYDVALFRRENGRYVLHRVKEVREKDYVFIGDNQIREEEGIRDSQIVGVMEGYVRNGKYRTVEDPRYRAYVTIWMHCRLLRYFSYILTVIRTSG